MALGSGDNSAFLLIQHSGLAVQECSPEGGRAWSWGWGSVPLGRHGACSRGRLCEEQPVIPAQRQESKLTAQAHRPLVCSASSFRKQRCCLRSGGGTQQAANELTHSQ